MFTQGDASQLAIEAMDAYSNRGKGNTFIREEVNSQAIAAIQVISSLMYSEQDNIALQASKFMVNTAIRLNMEYEVSDPVDDLLQGLLQ